jgi:non-ribosomal peptide synthetase component F
LPFEKLVETLNLPRDLSRHPLFQALFVVQMAAWPVPTFPGLTSGRPMVDTSVANFDLILSLVSDEQGFNGSWEYNRDLFEPATIARLADHYQTLLAEIVTHPTWRITDPGGIRRRTAALAGRLARRFRRVPADAMRSRVVCVAGGAQPSAPALVCNDQVTSYGALHARANQLAQHLRTLGVGPEVCVGVCLDRSPEWIVALLGVLQAGGAYLPLDPSDPPERLEALLADARPAVLLTQQRRLDALHAPENCRVVCVDRDGPVIARASTSDLPPAATPEQLAYIIYTSGATGRPKGAGRAPRPVQSGARPGARL